MSGTDNVAADYHMKVALEEIKDKLAALLENLKDGAWLASANDWEPELLEDFDKVRHLWEQVDQVIEFPGIVYLDKSVEELELSVRSYNCFKNADIRTIRDIVTRTEGDLLSIVNFGRVSLREVKEILAGMHLMLGMTNLPPQTEQ